MTQRVIIESPYSASNGNTVEENVAYARRCVRDSLMRGEAPIASHLLHTQPGILDDHVPVERVMGMEAGWEWYSPDVLCAVYTDLGWSAGMKAGFQAALSRGARFEYRRIGMNEEAA